MSNPVFSREAAAEFSLGRQPQDAQSHTRAISREAAAPTRPQVSPLRGCISTARHSTWGLRPRLSAVAASRLFVLLLLGLVCTNSLQAKQPTTRAALVETARQDVARELHNLDQFLAKGGAPIITGWDVFYDLPRLRAEIAAHDPDAKKLKEIWDRFYLPQAGSDAHFLSLRDSLHRYRLALALPDEDLAILRGQALGKLTAQTAAYHRSDARADAHALGETLGRLELLGMSDDAAVKSARQTFGYPNMYFSVSTRLANYFLTRPIDEREPLIAQIAGSTTSGHTHTVGTLSLAPAAQADHGALDIRMLGQCTMNDGLTQRGSVTVHGGAVTSIDARVRLRIREDGLSVDAPEVHCSTNSYINSVAADRRVVERIAKRRAPKELPEAEDAAARQAEERVRARLAKETTTLLAQANDIYADKFRAPMLRRGAWPKDVRFSSNEDGLQIRMTHLTGGQIAAPTAPPEWPAKGDLCISAHESMPENFFENVFGGREISDARVLYLFEVLTGEPSRALWVHDREPRWSMVMAEHRPLRTSFRDGEMRLTFAVDEVRRGDDRFTTPALVGAAFHVSATPYGPSITRTGDIEIQLAQREQISPQADELRAFLARKFDAILPKELFFDGLSAPSGGFGDKINKIKFQGATFDRGWATIRYQLEEQRKAKDLLISAPGK